MGGSKQYLTFGGFAKTEYRQLGTTSNGIKIIEKTNAKNSGSPLYSNTPNTIYAIRDSKSGELKQIVVYKSGDDNRLRSKDIDWTHKHGNFSVGEIHVQEYRGKQRSRSARKPSKKERRLAMQARNGR